MMHTDDEYDGPEPWEFIDYYLEDLRSATSQFERNKCCAELFRLAQYMDEEQREAAARAIDHRQPRKRGQPKKTRRDHEIAFLLRIGPVLGGLWEVPRNDAIKLIASRFKLTIDNARKAYDKAQKTNKTLGEHRMTRRSCGKK